MNQIIKPTRRMLTDQIQRLQEHAQGQELTIASILYHFKVSPAEIQGMVDNYMAALTAEKSLQIKTQ